MAIDTTAIPAVAEPTSPIKPSEALRLGRLIRPVRIENEFYEGRTGACALGAIATGYGEGPLDGEDTYNVMATGPKTDVLEHHRADCPGEHTGNGYAFGAKGWQVWEVLHHLNDDHHWSDDQIVDWLEGLGL